MIEVPSVQSEPLWLLRMVAPLHGSQLFALAIPTITAATAAFTIGGIIP